MTRPNLVFLHVDQLGYAAVGALGCRQAATPNLDRIFARGVSFRHSCIGNPICSPSRTTWYTGLMSEEHGQLTNDPDYGIDPRIADFGQQLRRGGYETFHMGKWHISKPAEKSFEVLFDGHVHGELGDAHTARAAEAFLSGRRSERPFLLNIGLLNPHDCCMWAYNFNPCSPAKFGLGARLEAELPPLPPNHRLAAYPTIASAPRDPTAGAWSDRDWQFYLYSYYRQVEMVDAEVGRILDAIERSPQADRTVLVFASDHGDGMAQHYHYGKDCLFEHSVMAPLVVVDPAVGAGRTDASHLVSNIDLAATLCDYAGVDPLPGRRGLSLRPLVEGRTPAWRDYVAASAVECRLRMIRTTDLKLIEDRVGGTRQLYDLARDPWEMRDLAADPAQAAALERLSALLAAHEATYRYAPKAARSIERWERMAQA